MRIAFFVQYSHPVGTYFRWHNLAIALHQAGHTVDVFAGDHNWKNAVRTDVKDGITYYIVPALHTARIFHNPNDPLSGIRRLFHLPKHDYDIYHLFQPFIHAFFPWWYLRNTKGKACFLYDWDDLWTGGFLEKEKYDLRDRYINKYVAFVERKAQQRSNAVTVCSDFLKQRVYSSIHSTIIHNGYWPRSKPDKAGMRLKWKLSDAFYLAYIGKTAGEIDWIIDGLNHLIARGYSDVKLIICGPPKNFLDQYAIDSNKHIIYLGEVKPEEAAEIAAASDLGLIPLEDSPFNQSRFPIKFFDFLAVGTSIYMSDVGEIGRIAESLSGVFKGAATKKIWIEQLENVIDDVRKNEHPVNVNSIKELFSWTAIGHQLADLYTTLINTKNPEN